VLFLGRRLERLLRKAKIGFCEEDAFQKMFSKLTSRTIFSFFLLFCFAKAVILHVYVLTNPLYIIESHSQKLGLVTFQLPGYAALEPMGSSAVQLSERETDCLHTYLHCKPPRGGFSTPKFHQ